MDKLLQKLKETKDNPGLYRALSPEEQAELFLTLFAPKPKLFEKPTVVKGIDGTTPVKDVDYIGKESAELFIADLADKTRAELEAIIQAKLSTLKPGEDGKDAVIDDALIARIADMAQSMIELPDFASLITMEPEAIRNSLELLPDGEKLAQEAIEGLPERLEAIENRPVQVIGGGISKNAVIKLIEENTTTGGAEWGEITGTLSNQTDLVVELDEIREQSIAFAIAL